MYTALLCMTLTKPIYYNPRFTCYSYSTSIALYIVRLLCNGNDWKYIFYETVVGSSFT